MPSFKIKPSKKIRVSKKNSTTLDGKHRELINEFHREEQCDLPLLKSKKEELMQLLEQDKKCHGRKNVCGATPRYTGPNY